MPESAWKCATGRRKWLKPSPSWRIVSLGEASRRHKEPELAGHSPQSCAAALRPLPGAAFSWCGFKLILLSLWSPFTLLISRCAARFQQAECCVPAWGGMVGAAGSQEGLVTEGDIWQTMLRKGLVSRMCIPWEMSLSLSQACRVGTSVLPALPHTGVSNFISSLLSFQRIVVKKCSRSESSIQTKSL